MDLLSFIKHYLSKSDQSYQLEPVNRKVPKPPANYKEILRTAARYDNLETIKQFFDTFQVEPDINLTCDHDGSTLLHIAAGYGCHKVLDYLLENNVDINAKDKHGSSALANACKYMRSETIRKLVQKGADVNLADFAGHTPLYFVLKKKNMNIIRFLLRNGANPEIKSIKGTDCFDKAEDLELKQFIRDHYVLYQLLKNQFTLDEVEMMVEGGLVSESELVKVYFELVLRGDEFIYPIQLLTKHYPGLPMKKLKSSHCSSPLHRAAGCNYMQIATFLLQQGSDPNATDENGVIPLHNAAFYGHLKMVQLLINNGSDVKKADNTGYTPLHIAAEGSKTLICMELLDRGADRSMRTHDGRTPYDLAKGHPEIEALLKENRESVPEGIYVPLENLVKKTDDVEDQLDDPLMIDTEQEENLIRNPNNRDKMKIVFIEPTDVRYELIKERMQSTIVKHESGPIFSHYNIIKISKILNEKLYQEYRHRQRELKRENCGRSNEKLLFHGSPGFDSIPKKGFDERLASIGGMFGAGIYFAEHSSKSNQYTFGLNRPCSEHNDKSCYLCVRHLFYCQVALGKTLEVKDVYQFAHAPPDHHSVSALPEILGPDNLAYPEYIIYRGEQAYPLYMIEYTLLSG